MAGRIGEESGAPRLCGSSPPIPWPQRRGHLGLCADPTVFCWGEGRMEKEAAARLKESCCQHRYGKVIASSALLHVRFHLLPQLFP